LIKKWDDSEIASLVQPDDVILLYQAEPAARLLMCWLPHCCSVRDYSGSPNITTGVIHLVRWKCVQFVEAMLTFALRSVFLSKHRQQWRLNLPRPQSSCASSSKTQIKVSCGLRPFLVDMTYHCRARAYSALEGTEFARQIGIYWAPRIPREDWKSACDYLWKGSWWLDPVITCWQQTGSSQRRRGYSR